MSLGGIEGGLGSVAGSWEGVGEVCLFSPTIWLCCSIKVLFLQGPRIGKGRVFRYVRWCGRKDIGLQIGLGVVHGVVVSWQFRGWGLLLLHSVSHKIMLSPCQQDMSGKGGRRG